MKIPYVHPKKENKTDVVCEASSQYETDKNNAPATMKCFKCGAKLIMRDAADKSNADA